jgi:hypothetical protein
VKLEKLPSNAKVKNKWSYASDICLTDERRDKYRVIKSLCAMKNSVYSNNPHTVDELKMATTECIRNVDHAILNTVFENTVRRVNKCLETGGGHFEHYL